MLGFQSQKGYLDSLVSASGQYGVQYWVSPSGSASNDGLSPERPKLTMATAVTASDTDITSNAYHRNTIYLMGGTFAEALTVWPGQCDVVGLGRRTAWKVLMNGVQTIAAAKNSSQWWGVGFHQTTAAPNVTLHTGSHGWGFHDCEFICGGGSVTYGLHVTNTSSAVLEDCMFVGNPPFPTAVYIAGPLFNGCIIRRNYISAETCGIYLHSNVTSDYQTVIHDNIIGRMDPNAGATQLTKGIDFNTDSANNFLIVHNFISAADGIEPHASAGDKGEFMCIDNYVNESTTALREDSLV